MNRMLNNYKFNEFLQATTYAEKVTCSEHISKYLRVTATHVEDITPTFSGYRPAQRKVVTTKSSSYFRLEPNGTCAIRPRLLRKLRCEQLAVPQTRFGKTCFGSQALPNLQHVSRLFCTPAPKSDNACLHVSGTPPPTSLRGTTKNIVPLIRHASVEAQERGGAHIVCPGPCPSRWTARA